LQPLKTTVPSTIANKNGRIIEFEVFIDFRFRDRWPRPGGVIVAYNST
jgi:hypothetical protein